MKSLQEIQEQCARGEIEFSDHALLRMRMRKITSTEILEALSVAEVVEQYPDDKYGASMLILGFTASGRPLHIQVTAYHRKTVKVITGYEPDEEQWIHYRERKKR